MKIQMLSNENPKFTLPLKSYTQNKRLIEAKKELLNIYPFEVPVENILILKSNRKGFYDVYISKEKVKRELNVKKICLISILCGLICIFLYFVLQHVAKQNIENLAKAKEVEKQKTEKARINKEKKEILARLRKEYHESKLTEYGRIYPYIERIYSVMTDKTTIENVSIEKNIFTVEVTTKDAIKILSNFENSDAFSLIKMNRSNVKNETEFVAYSGEFSRYQKEPDSNLSIDEKIDFYKTELEKVSERKKELSYIALSDYIKNIRDILRKNSCYEQYIQLRGKNKNAEVEFYVLSTSKNILNFIKEIQNNDNNLIDIKIVKIFNSDDRNRIQTTIIFDSGIGFEQDNNQLTEYVDRKIELDEIDKLFSKTSSIKQTVTNKSVLKVTNSEKGNQMQQKVTLRKLSYIGLSKIHGETIVMVKDNEMGSIYKLKLTETELGEDCCVKATNGYTAKIRGEYYEVIK